MEANNNPQLITPPLGGGGYNSRLIRVAVTDDHKVVVDGLDKIINESGIAVLTGKSYDAAGCRKMLEAAQPDVLLLDIGLPDESGMILCPKIKEKYPMINILILTNYSEYTVISHILNNGASGYILKNAMPEEIVEGIRTVASGKQFLCEEVDMLLESEKEDTLELTRREFELLRLIYAGNSNAEIADKMFLGYETIKSYRKNLFQKLNVHNTTQLMKIIVEKNLL